MHPLATTFRALGCPVHVSVRRVADLGLAGRLARLMLADVDEVCSRFRHDSDLTRVNARPGTWVEVDPLLVAAVRVAVDAAERTDGLVNPLLGRPMVQLGYDRTFDRLTETADDDASMTPFPVPPDPNAWRSIAFDDHALRIPEGTALDLGATGKAWAADLIAAAYARHLRGSAVISVGGDLAIAAPDDEPWPIAVSERPGSHAVTIVLLSSGGMATSSTQVRRWTRNGAQRHHLLDPRTARPADEVWRTVTAAGETATGANTASTASIVLGHDAQTWLAEHDVTARLVARDGTVHHAGRWPTKPRRAA